MFASLSRWRTSSSSSSSLGYGWRPTVLLLRGCCYHTTVVSPGYFGVSSTDLICKSLGRFHSMRLMVSVRGGSRSGPLSFGRWDEVWFCTGSCSLGASMQCVAGDDSQLSSHTSSFGYFIPEVWGAREIEYSLLATTSCLTPLESRHHLGSWPVTKCFLIWNKQLARVYTMSREDAVFQR